MKCPTCESCEHEQYCGATEIMRKCDRHNKKVQMTNEEWLRSCNTEQLADVIADFYLLGYTHGHNKMDITSRTKWTEWLKEKHE